MYEFYLTGDLIGTFTTLSSSGAGAGSRVTLGGVTALGTVDDYYRIVITPAPAPGVTTLQSGQTIQIFAWPGLAGDQPLYTLSPDPAAFSGVAASAVHQIFTPQNVIFDLRGITTTTLGFGPGGGNLNDTSGDFNFSALPTDPPIVPCFVKGTLIMTDRGEVAIETLSEGDLVMTADHGLQPLRWIGWVTVPGTGPRAPIHFAAGSIGNRRALTVSPQHRMLVTDARAELLFGASEVLVAAKHLVNDQTIRQVPCAEVTYLHMIFDNHEIVFAEGAPSESLHLGETALGTLDSEARAEVLELFPHALSIAQNLPTARPCLRAYEARMIATPGASAAA